MTRKVGRPAKNGVNLHCLVSPLVLQWINEQCALTKKSQGDIVGDLVSRARLGDMVLEMQPGLMLVRDIDNRLWYCDFTDNDGSYPKQWSTPQEALENKGTWMKQKKP